MLDFMKVGVRKGKRERDPFEVYPKFLVKPSTDLMIRGGDFYAIWDEQTGLWRTSEFDAIELIDRELDIFMEKNQDRLSGAHVQYMWDSESGMIDKWHRYCQKHLRDSFTPLDEKLIFSNTETKKTDYASKKLSYPLQEGSIESYDAIMSVLYSEAERKKLEWAIGSIVEGDSKWIQKFIVLYGAQGTGKSTILNIVQDLFEGYFTVFDAKALGSSSNSFALEAFKSNPLVAIQHDGDLSKIEDNTRLNSLVSHELMTVNEKFKSTYTNRFISFLFMGTNRPVKITDAKSGLLRRLIDVSPTGNKVPYHTYTKHIKNIKFELGAIAHHCHQVYLSDPDAYNDYVPTNMLGASNDFYNFIQDSHDIFFEEDSTTLKSSWEMYKDYCDDANITYPLTKRVFKEEMKNYFKEYEERARLPDGTHVRNYYSVFTFGKNANDEPPKDTEPLVDTMVLKEQTSIFDTLYADRPAQYANEKETPYRKWENVKTTLASLDTSLLHYVMVPDNHIVIDFDLKDESGEKSLEKNLAAASTWPGTYAELSKSGKGVHLHYIYDGDVEKLSRIFDHEIEVKVFTGKSSLRRKLTKCNDKEIRTINSGLPLKGDGGMNKEFEWDKMNEKGVRTIIKRNLAKEYHGATKPSVDFIFATLEKAYESGISYDVSDMRNAVLAFAANSTNQADTCVKLVGKMKFKSKEIIEDVVDDEDLSDLIFYDVEVYPNLFLICWKVRGEGKKVVRMFNPKPHEIESLIEKKLVGFNCRRYDNHILYAALIGWNNEQIHQLSQDIITKGKGYFGAAYNLSYTDVYDFSSKKQSLKKWEIELEIRHKELDIPWDEPVSEDLWEVVADYCDNDVLATEAVFEARQADFTARQILADLAEMPVNTPTNTLTAKIIFGNDPNPRLYYTDLATGERS